jgi:phosphomannomutase
VTVNEHGKMSEGLIVSVSGIRGIVGRDLGPDQALAFSRALAASAPAGPVIVGRDTRSSGIMLGHAVSAGLLASGREVIDIGIVPTPTCGLAVRLLRGAAGIQITASHNSAEWNGLKLFNRQGRVLSASDGRSIQQVFENRTAPSAAWNQIGTSRTCGDAVRWHRDRVLDLVDVKSIREMRPRVFVDANGGAGGALAIDLLEQMGCVVIPHACDLRGEFLHEPEPIEANVREVGKLVRWQSAQLGCVLDPDADRLALFDETGRYIGEELTLALAALSRLEHERGPLVINLSTSRVNEDIARQFGVRCYRAAVGEANVVDQMIKVKAVLGGEGNGGVIDPRVGFVRDPFIALALILSLAGRRQQTIGELVAGLPVYHMVKAKFAIDRQKLPRLFEELCAHWPDARLDRGDGLRLSWADRWLNVRASNTEPLVRVIAEAPGVIDATQMAHEVEERIKKA